MVESSLQASQDGIELARKAFIGTSLTQEQLAIRLNVSRQPISKFFNGKPITRGLFVQICQMLKLDWQEVACVQLIKADGDIDQRVRELRELTRASIYEQCNMMRVLDMEQPVRLSAIYTNVNILDRMTGRRRLTISDLLEQYSVEDFERFGLATIWEARVDGLEAVERHDKLMVLGKPGSGKTTFLKRLAMLCIDEEFQADRIPIFVSLKAFAEIPRQPPLFIYLCNHISHNQGGDQLSRVSHKLQAALAAGQVLILLDGLDEVKDVDSQRIINEIQEFAKRYHRNQFVITCRIAAREYAFEQFTEVEIADFDDKQILDFVTKWFRTKDNPAKIKNFLEKLENHNRIKELATSPLLLTLLCLVFGESTDFPENRSELYEEGLDVLLKKWDATRNIERDRAYKKLSRQRKEDLLSYLAFTFFEQNEYFFKQRKVVDQIIEFICNAPNITSDEMTLELDGVAVLKSIEAQHGLLIERARGIYSFSHLTFQEYFVARQIKEQRSDALLEDLLSHITEKRWGEVFRLTAEMLPNADQFFILMKCRIDQILAGDRKLQQFMIWVQGKSQSVKTSYKPTVVRAFYFTLALSLARKLDPSLACELADDRARDSAREQARGLAQVLADKLARNRDYARTLVRDLSLARDPVDDSTHTQDPPSATRARAKHLVAELESTQALANDLKSTLDLNLKLNFNLGLDFGLCHNFILNLAVSFPDCDLVYALDKVSSIEFDLDCAFSNVCALARTLDLDERFSLERARIRDLARALNLDLARTLDASFIQDLDYSQTSDVALPLNRALDLSGARDLARDLALAFALDRTRALDLAIDLDLDLALSLAHALDLEPEFSRELINLKQELPDFYQGDRKELAQWWSRRSLPWIQQLRHVIIENRNFGHDWQFNNVQLEKLRQYYDASKLMIDCLNTDCYVDRKLRREIEETLLLLTYDAEQN
ncbi:MAG: NACHT domain-containing NTPase [Leptolyngbya sp. UWPOB_LEPTO1]|uniref:NACHT domain-containing protein n=1 Tax=Leptolyngbya sp. UWPOB_LEPTO1 TaxID=2815653 RepID=UPI001AC2DCA9|nr:NACHT domain-containing NTPase [Leptolyngbya sp. UWPOB_LEPTO1]MBN8561086.1 NACHT domain-containing NTPase [Leptolyngbya sp. UWPOB_LEPTO1]